MPPLLSFKAGRSLRRGDTNWVDSQPERGHFTLENEDDLLHLRHSVAGTAAGEPLDLILFSGDATVERASGRVFVLKFTSSEDRTFFWFQDVSDAEDDRRLRRINELIEDINAPEEPAGASRDVEMSAWPAVEPASASSSVPAPSPALQPATSTSSGSANTQLRDILSQFAGQQQPEVAPYTLNGILEPGPMSIFLNSLPQSDIDELIAYLPPGIPHDRQTLARVVASPDFKRGVATFDAGLRTGALGPVIASLGLPEQAALGVSNYLEALKQQAGSGKTSDQGGGSMQVD